MKKDNQSASKQLSQLNRTQIARATFAAAETMGISDRNQIERLTRQVIERLEQRTSLPGRGYREQSQPLPGMEDLVPRSYRQQKHLTSDSEILALVKEFLDAEEAEQSKEAEPIMKARSKVRAESEITSPINLTENSRRVLERRYLQKDRQGNIIETPEGLFPPCSTGYRLCRAYL